ncbi:hypothetical protein IAT40_001241 [Kwoniella sp. CBS 6097]
MTTLEPLFPVQHLIFDHLKRLIPLKLLRVSKSLYEELLPTIYTTIKLDEKNIGRFLQGQRLNVPPVYHGKKRGMTYTKTLEFVDKQTAFDWTWFVDYQYTAKRGVLDSDDCQAKSADEDEGSRNTAHVQWDSKEIWFPNLETFVWGSSLVEGLINMSRNWMDVEPEERLLTSFSEDVINILKVRTIVINAPRTRVGWPDNRFFLHGLIGFSEYDSEYPVKEVVVQVSPGSLHFPLSHEHARYAGDMIAALWDLYSTSTTYDEQSPVSLKCVLRGPKGLANLVEEWAGAEAESNDGVKDFLDDLEVVEIDS